MKTQSAKERMSRQLVTVAWDDPMEKANGLMEEWRVRHLPVTDKEGFVIGILSDRDVSRAMNPGRPGFDKDRKVCDYMSWPAVTVDESTPLKDIAEGMADEKLSAFLVTKGGDEVVGIVTSEDLLRFLAASLKEKRFSLRELPYAPVVREMLSELSAAGI